MYENLETKLRKELAVLDEKFKGNAEMTEGDLKKADMISHALKSIATYCAMKESYQPSHNSYNSYNSYENSYNHPYNRSYPERDMYDTHNSYDFRPPYERRW